MPRRHHPASHSVLMRKGVYFSYTRPKKVIFLAIQEASRNWAVPIKNWKAALNRFMMEFEDRLAEYV